MNKLFNRFNPNTEEYKAEQKDRLLNIQLSFDKLFKNEDFKVMVQMLQDYREKIKSSYIKQTNMDAIKALQIEENFISLILKNIEAYYEEPTTSTSE